MGEYDDDDELDELLDRFTLPEESELSPRKRIVLQILDGGGNIEDILFDIEDIYKYVNDVYNRCPERNY
jgi:hypothetical protein